MDSETRQVNEKNNHLLDLVNHQGWKEARQILVEKIVELQNVAEYIEIIQTGNATKLLKEMKANARAAEILFDWLRQIEGNAQTAIEMKVPKEKSFVVRLDEEED